MADNLYPPGPAAVPTGLTAPNRRYRRHAWLALLGLTTWVLLYLGASAWFLYRSYCLFSDPAGDRGLLPLVAAVSYGLLGIFLLKGLFGSEKTQGQNGVEITPQSQPRLFEFLHRLADEAGAPRPHKVFLSARVNAAVFYELSLMNLIVPSTKNLEIGLGAVNGLSLGELKAVLAHEFGHFAQRSMAVGRWVYTAQRIAANIIGKRDWFDSLLSFLSGIDIRIAWLGWLLRLMVWSLRAILDTLFGVVVLAQRALSREMEFQADLVAVSLTGSDALIHALHRLGPADDAWEQAIHVASVQFEQKKRPLDLFRLQSKVLTHMAHVLDDPNHGKPPSLAADPSMHRVFSEALAETPRMWSTHPSNADREANAKRRYVPCSMDDRSAWELFDKTDQLRWHVTDHLFKDVEGYNSMQILTVDQEDAALERRFRATALHPRFRGTYLGRSPAAQVKDPLQLIQPMSPEQARAELAGLYPEHLRELHDQLGHRAHEHASLEALRLGILAAPGGVIRHQGRTLKRKQLPDAIAEAKRLLSDCQDKVTAHDRMCRSVHIALATGRGDGWGEYTQSLVLLLHYATHQLANLNDALGHQRNVLSVVLADGKVSDSERKRLVGACKELWDALHDTMTRVDSVQLPQALRERMEVDRWKDMLPDNWPMSKPAPNNLQSWLPAVETWVDAVSSCLGFLEHATLEHLLQTEQAIEQWATSGEGLSEAAPAPARVPRTYVTLAPGQERQRQRRLDWWDRFQVADGLFPSLLRLAVAGGILGILVSLGG